MNIDYNLISDLEFDDIDPDDYPDFSSAFISDATYDGDPMSDEMLEELNNDRGFVYEKLLIHLF